MSYSSLNFIDLKQKYEKHQRWKIFFGGQIKSNEDLVQKILSPVQSSIMLNIGLSSIRCTTPYISSCDPGFYSFSQAAKHNDYAHRKIEKLKIAIFLCFLLVLL